MEYSRSNELEETGGTPEHIVPHFQDHFKVISDLWVELLDKHRMDRESLNPTLYCVRTLKFLSITF